MNNARPTPFILILFGIALVCAAPLKPAIAAPTFVDQVRVEVSFDSHFKVRLSCRVSNSTDRAIFAPQRIPVVAHYWTPPEEELSWARGQVNGEPVALSQSPMLDRVRIFAAEEARLKAETQPGSKPRRNRLSFGATQAQLDAWKARLESWINEDAALSEAHSRCQKTAQEFQQLYRRAERLNGELKKHLENINPKIDLYALSRFMETGPDDGRNTHGLYLSGQVPLNLLTRLMPKIDPSLRIETGNSTNTPMTLLDESRYQAYQAYEEKWTRQMNEWIRSNVASHPPLSDLPRMRRRLGELATELSDQREWINQRLHDSRGLDMATVTLWNNYHRSPYFPEAMARLVRALFPDVEAAWQKRAEEERTRLSQWGFDGSRLSPYTGRLVAFDKIGGPRHSQRFDPRFADYDPAVREVLGLPKPNSKNEPLHPWDFGRNPSLLSLKMEVPPRGSSRLSLEYDVRVAPLIGRADSRVSPSGPRELFIPFPAALRKKPLDVKITMPPDTHPLIVPDPMDITTYGDGSREFRVRIDDNNPALHVIPIDSNSLSIYSGEIRCLPGIVATADIPHPRWSPNIETMLPGSLRVALPELQERQRVASDTFKKLAAAVTNKTVRPAVLWGLLPTLGKWEAHRARRQLRNDYPDCALFDMKPRFVFELPLLDKSGLIEWFEQKSRRPLIRDEADFGRIRKYSAKTLPDCFEELSRRLQGLDPASLTPEEQLGRCFLLAQAGVRSQEHVRQLVSLAEMSPELTGLGLRLIAALTVEKPEAFEFVLKHSNYPTRYGSRSLLEMDPLQTFRASSLAPRLLQLRSNWEHLAIFRRLDLSLQNMTLEAPPDDWIAWARRADALDKAKPEIVTKHYLPTSFQVVLDLLLRSHKAPPVALLEQLYEDYPAHRPRIARHLWTAQGTRGLETAITTINTTDDKDYLSTATTTILALGQPSDLARITYRRVDQLPHFPWGETLGSRLLKLCRERATPPEAWPFVEAYYLAELKNATNYNSDCVRAFETMGNPRAIPYLKHIVRHELPKEDAAIALGSLQLKVKRSFAPPNELTRKAGKLLHYGVPNTEFNSILEELLAGRTAFLDMLFRRNGPVRRMLKNNQTYILYPGDVRSSSYLPRLGTPAARRFLEVSRDCRLAQRYQLARILSQLDPECHTLLRSAAREAKGNLSQRRTALLALGIARDRSAIPLLDELLKDANLSVNAASALSFFVRGN